MWVAYTAKIHGITEFWQYYGVCGDYNGIILKILGDEWINPWILSIQSLEAHQCHKVWLNFLPLIYHHFKVHFLSSGTWTCLPLNFLHLGCVTHSCFLSLSRWASPLCFVFAFHVGLFHPPLFCSGEGISLIGYQALWYAKQIYHGHANQGGSHFLG